MIIFNQGKIDKEEIFSTTKHMVLTEMQKKWSCYSLSLISIN